MIQQNVCLSFIQHEYTSAPNTFTRLLINADMPTFEIQKAESLTTEAQRVNNRGSKSW